MRLEQVLSTRGPWVLPRVAHSNREETQRVAPVTASARPERGPYTGRGARTDGGRAGDRTRGSVTV